MIISLMSLSEDLFINFFDSLDDTVDKSQVNDMINDFLNEYYYMYSCDYSEEVHIDPNKYYDFFYDQFYDIVKLTNGCIPLNQQVDFFSYKINYKTTGFYESLPRYKDKISRKKPRIYSLN